MLKNINWTNELGKTAIFPYNKEAYCLLHNMDLASVRCEVLIDLDREKQITLPARQQAINIVRQKEELQALADSVDSIIFLDTPADFTADERFASQWKEVFDFALQHKKKCLFNNYHLAGGIRRELDEQKIPYGTPHLNAQALSHYSGFYQAYLNRKGLKSKVIGFFGTANDQFKNICMFDFYRYLKEKSQKTTIIAKNGTGFLYGFSHLVSSGLSLTKYQYMLKSFIMEENEINNSFILLSGPGSFSKNVYSLDTISSIPVDYPVLVVNVFDEARLIKPMIEKMRLFHKEGRPPAALYVSSCYKSKEGIVEVPEKALAEKVALLEKEFKGTAVTARPWIEKLFPTAKKESKKIS